MEGNRTASSKGTTTKNGGLGGKASPKRSTRYSFLGPFHFAKGPAYFIPTTAARQIVQSTELRIDFDATVVSANITRPEKTIPWEDVYTGMALTQVASGASMASVHMHMALYAESFQFASTQSVLLWHMKIKRPGRIADVERWSQQQPPCMAI